MSSRYCSPVVDWDLGVSPNAFVPQNHNHGLLFWGGGSNTPQGRDMMVIWTLERTYIANSEHGPPIRHHIFLPVLPSLHFQNGYNRSGGSSAIALSQRRYHSGLRCFLLLLYILCNPTLSKLDSQGRRSISTTLPSIFPSDTNPTMLDSRPQL